MSKTTMDSNAKVAKIKSIINSCLTYCQVQTCFTFIDFVPFEYRRKILLALQEKAYKMRNDDLNNAK